MAFANMGYHAFVLRYSVYQEDNPGMFIPEPGAEVPVKEHCVHPNPIRDIARAMLEIRTHAEEWLVDTDRIAICGFSAGAHNCAMYATNWHKPVISEYFGKDPGEFRPAACILGYTLSDYIEMKNQADTDPLFIPSNIALLGTATADDALLTEVSPARNVTENCPPMFLWATSEDTLVPVQHTILMSKALADKQIPFEVHIFENGPHGLSTATQSSATALSHCMPDVAKWLPLCDTWLKKRFALSLPPKTFWEMMEEQNR
jgi:acetyl esterase/lipase